MDKAYANDDPRLIGPAVQAFSRTAEAWSLSELEQAAILGKPVHDAFNSLHSVGADLQLEALQRVSYVLGIYRALHTIFPSPQQADTWIRRANNAALFNGQPALALMCSGRLDDLALVREYLESLGIADA